MLIHLIHFSELWEMPTEEFIHSFEEVEVCGEILHLLPSKAIYWPRKSLLLIADLHLGKSTHFRKNGIAVPYEVSERNWKLLQQLFRLYCPDRVCFLGDLFHSKINREWKVFGELLQLYPQIQFELVMGNHDVLTPADYLELKLKVHSEVLLEPPFLLSHEPTIRPNCYNLAGHIHPAVRLRGRGKQFYTAACFIFGKHSAILPAFGEFTGWSIQKPGIDQRTFIVAANQVMEF